MNKILSKSISLLLAVIVAISVCSMLTLDAFALTGSDYGDFGGTVYYVDNVQGNDESNGTTPSTAWKSLDKVNATALLPGDQILFKSGGVWNGRILPQGSGAEGKPIIIGKYGGDTLPIINGASAFYDGFFEGSTILLYNQEYFEIYDLSITNSPNQSMASCFGIWVVAEDFGVADHYIIERCYFSKITTNTRSSINNILKYNSVVDNYTRVDGINGTAIKFTCLVGSVKIPTKFNGIRVLNNEIANTALTAISVGSDWGDHQVSGWVVDQEEMTFSTDIRIANNVIYGTGAAVTLFNVDGSKGEGCIVENNVCWNNDNGHSFWVMWSASTIDLVYRGNEIFGMDQNSGADDGVFDADGQSVGTVFEYNYTHHNAGPIYIPCNIEWDDADFADAYVRSCVWRYNISFNDNWRGLRNKGTVYADKGAENSYFYNNLIVTDSYDVKVFDLGDKGLHLYNNIFYNLETYREAEVSCRWDTLGENMAYVNNNVFYGIDKYISMGENEQNTVYTSYSDFEDAGIKASNNLTVDPMLNIPLLPTIDSENGNTTTKTGDNCYNAYLNNDAEGDHHGIANVIAKGYFTLKDGSPCIGAGKLIKSNGGLDFFGNPVSETQAPDIGAHQYTDVVGADTAKSITNFAASDIKEHSFDVSWQISSKGAAIHRYVLLVNDNPYYTVHSPNRKTADNTLWGPCIGNDEIFTNKKITVEDLDFGTNYTVKLRAYYGLGESDYIESNEISVNTLNISEDKRTLTVKDMTVTYYNGDTHEFTDVESFNADEPIHIEATVVDGNGKLVRGATVRLLIEAVGLENVIYDVGVTGSDGIARLGTRSIYLPESVFEYKLSVWAVEKEGYTYTQNYSKSVYANGFDNKYNLNLLSNSNFKGLNSAGLPTDWRLINANAIKILKDEGPHGANVADIRSSSRVTSAIRQDVDNIPNGKYTLTAWIRNNNTASTISVSRAGKNNNKNISIPINEEWTQIVIPEINITSNSVTVNVSATLFGDYSQFTQICNIELSRNMMYNTAISSLIPAKGLTLPANFYYKTANTTVDVNDTNLTDAQNDKNLKAIKLNYYTGENYQNAVYINSDEAFNVTMGQYKKNLTSGNYTFSASTLSTGGVSGVMRIRDGENGPTYESVINSSSRYQTTKITANINSGCAYVEFVFSGDGNINEYISILEMSFSNRSDTPSTQTMTVLPGQNIMESLNGDFERDGKVTNYIATGWELNNYIGYFDAYVVDEDKHSGDYSLKCTLDEKAYHNKAGTQFTQGGVTPSMDFTNLPAGTYTFRAWIRSNVKFKIGVKTQKQTVSYIPWYEYTDDEWHELVIENIKVIDGTLQIDTWFDRSAQPDSIKLDEDLVLYAYLDDVSITLNDENAIENGGAEKIMSGAPAGWKVTDSKGYASLEASRESYEGDYCAMAVLPGKDSSLTFTFDELESKSGSFALSTFVRGNGKIKLSVQTDNGTPVVKEFDTSEEWTEITINDIQIDSLVNSVAITVTNLSGNTSSFVSFDNLRFSTLINSSVIARTLPSVAAVKLGENITMPEPLLEGYTVTIESVSDESILSLDGSVNIPDENSFITVTFKIQNDKDSNDVSYASRIVTVYGYE